MGRQPIKSVIDKPAIRAELAALKKMLQESAVDANRILKVKVDIENAGNLKELTSGLKNLGGEIDNLKKRNLELSNQQKEFNFEVAKEREERRKLVQQRKEQAAAEKQAAAEAVNAQREKNALLAEEKRKQEELAGAESARANAEANRLGVPTSNTRAQLVQPAPVSPSFVPANDLEAAILTESKLQAELDDTIKKRKELGKALRDGKISQAEYDSELVKARQLENELKISVSQLNKEIELQSKINFASPDSIDQARARVKQLSAQRDAISAGGSATPEEIAQIKELNRQIDVQNELIDKNSDKLARQKINIGNYPKAFQNASSIVSAELGKINEAVSKVPAGSDAYNSLITKQISLSNAVTLTNKGFQTNTGLVKNYQEAAAELGRTFGTDSDIFKNFSKEVAVGGAQVIEFDRNVKTATTSGSKIGAVLSGIGSTAVRLARILPGLGIAGLIGFAVEPIINFIGKLFEATAAEKKLAEQAKQTAEFQKSIADNYGKEAGQLKIMRAEIESTAVSMDKRLQTIKDIKKEYPEYFQGLTNEQLLNGQVADAYDKASAAILRKAKAQAAATEIEKLATKELEVELRDLQDVEQTNKILKNVKDQVITIRGLSDAAGTQRVNTADAQKAAILGQFKERQRLRQEEVNDIKKQQEYYLQFAVSGANETIKIEKDKAAKVRGIRENEIKDNTEESILQSRFNINKRIIQLQIDQAKDIVNNDKRTTEARLQALGDYAIAVQSMTALETQYEVDQEYIRYKNLITSLEKQKKEKGANVKAINAQEEREFVAHSKKLLDIRSKNEYESIQFFRDLNKLKEDIEADGQKKIQLRGIEEMRKGRQAVIDEETERQKKIQKIREEYADKQKKANADLLSELKQTFFSFLNDTLTREEQALDRKREINDKDTARRIEQINALGLIEDERNRQTMAVQKQAAYQNEVIEARKREIAVQRARYEKAATITNIIQSTAQAIMGALSQVKTVGPAATALAFTYGAIGALQLARAISSPIPRYKFGKSKNDPYQGLAEVGDGGVSEYIVRQSGKIEKTPAVPTLTYLMTKDVVYKDENSFLQAMMNASNPFLKFQGVVNKIPESDYNRDLLIDVKQQLILLNRKGTPVIHNHAPIETTVWYMTQVKGYK